MKFLQFTHPYKSQHFREFTGCPSLLSAKVFKCVHTFNLLKHLLKSHLSRWCLFKGVRRKMLLMISSLFLQHVLLGWFVRWEVSSHTVAVGWVLIPKYHSILMFPPSFFSMYFVSTDMATVGENSCFFILSEYKFSYYQ